MREDMTSPYLNILILLMEWRKASHQNCTRIPPLKSQLVSVSSSFLFFAPDSSPKQPDFPWPTPTSRRPPTDT